MPDVDGTALVSSVKKRKRRAFSATEKIMMCNMYHSFKAASPSKSNNEICKTIADSMGIHWISIYNVLKEQRENNGVLKPPKKTKARSSIITRIDDFIKCNIRIIVHKFFLRKEIPTVDKVLKAVNEDNSLGVFKRTTLYKILKKIGFKFDNKCRNSFLNDRDDIFFWRRNYLRQIKEARQNNRKIYYLDESWVNEGHTTHFSSGLKNPTGKGKHLIIAHIGSEDGFVNGGLLTYESEKQGDHNQDMNAQMFENWFFDVLDKLEDNSVVVMDNSLYHSRKIEKVPTAKNKKREIIDWLKDKNIPFLDDMFKRELLNIVKVNRERYEARVIDEMAKAKNKTVLRLPPYHCELNPIELIWAQIKDHVASKTKTFKMAEIKKLLIEAIDEIDSMRWKKCIQHVTEAIEPKLNEMDKNIDEMTDSLIINVGCDSSSSDTSWDSE